MAMTIQVADEGKEKGQQLFTEFVNRYKHIVKSDDELGLMFSIYMANISEAIGQCIDKHLKQPFSEEDTHGGRIM
jgi:hypothetical protein